MRGEVLVLMQHRTSTLKLSSRTLGQKPRRRLPCYKFGTRRHYLQSEFLLSWILVHLQSLQYVGQYLVINLVIPSWSQLLIVLRRLFVTITVRRVPSTVFEADSNAWTGTYRQEEMVDQICGNVICFWAIWSHTIIYFHQLNIRRHKRVHIDRTRSPNLNSPEG